MAKKADEVKEEGAVTPVAIAEVEESETLPVATETGSSVPAERPATPLGAATGEIDQSDIKLPTLRIIQKMSDNPEKLDEGMITLDNTLVVEGARGKTRLTVVSIHKYFKEVLPFGAGMPKMFDTAQEAANEGYKVARSKADRDSGVPIVEDCARAVVLIEKPEGAMDRAFPYELDGVRCTPAIWFIQSSAYRAVAKTIFSKMAFELKATGLLPAVWTLTADGVDGKQGKYYVPRLVLNATEERSDKFVADIKEQMTF